MPVRTTIRGINTFFVPEEKFTLNLEKENKVAIMSQSGALGIIEIDNLKNAISPKVIVSYGNQLDIDPCDPGRLLPGRPHGQRHRLLHRGVQTQGRTKVLRCGGKQQETGDRLQGGSHRRPAKRPPRRTPPPSPASMQWHGPP